jgi:hypothetical protein
VVQEPPAILLAFDVEKRGHLARNYRKPPRRREANDTHMMPGGKQVKTGGEQRSDLRLYSIGCAETGHCDYVTLEIGVRQGHKLYFLVDSGVDISLAKSEKLLSRETG